MELSFSISPSNEYSGLISFRMDWFDLLDVQGTLKRLLQDHNLKVSILWYSAFFMVHLSHPYMTAGKTIAMTIWTFAGKMMSLLFNMLSRFVVVFFPRNKVKVKVKSLSRVQLFVTPWTAAYQTPPSMGVSRQEYWSGVPLEAEH